MDKMSLNEFIILANSLNREYIHNEKYFSFRGGGVITYIYNNDLSRAVYVSIDGNAVYCSVGQTALLRVDAPFLPFGKKHKQFKEALDLIRSLFPKKAAVEQEIIKTIPCAKDVIADRVIIDE